MSGKTIPVNKKTVMSSFSIPKDLLEEFSEVCYQRRLKRATVITSLVRDFVSNMKKQDAVGM